MRDLEIRGAGNLLGPQQSGYIMEVGFNLYCRLLQEAVSELRGKVASSSPVATSINLDIQAFLPVTYIKDGQQRVNIYKKMAGITNHEELNDLKGELVDRFGEYPQEVTSLLEVIGLRIIAQCFNIVDIRQNLHQVNIEFSRNINFPVDRFTRLANIKEYKKRVSFSQNDNFTIFIKDVPRFHKDLLRFLKKILQKLN